VKVFPGRAARVRERRARGGCGRGFSPDAKAPTAASPTTIHPSLLLLPILGFLQSIHRNRQPASATGQRRLWPSASIDDCWFCTSAPKEEKAMNQSFKLFILYFNQVKPNILSDFDFSWYLVIWHFRVSELIGIFFFLVYAYTFIKLWIYNLILLENDR
jgi:hypothetical protein